MSRATFGVLSRRLLILLLFAQATTAANDGITIESAWIEMPDGVRLAADVYKPSDLKPGVKLPALLEYTAYRKTDSRSLSRLRARFLALGRGLAY